MKAIFTKYIGPTNSRGSRVKAYDGDQNSVTLSWDDSLDSDDNHRAAAKALCSKMNWNGRMIMGGHKDVNVHVFCEVDHGMGGRNHMHGDKYDVGVRS
jgi:hypothetical protein